MHQYGACAHWLDARHALLVPRCNNTQGNTSPTAIVLQQSILSRWNEAGTCRLHRFLSTLSVAGVDLHSSNSVSDDRDAEPESTCVEYRLQNAVVSRKTADIQHLDAPAVQPALKVLAGRLERTVTVVGVSRPLVQNQQKPPGVESCSELRAIRARDTMRRPAAEVDAVCRVPVARGDDGGKPWHPCVDDRNDGVPSGHGQSAARAEVILDVDNEQGRLWTEGFLAHDDRVSIRLRRRSNSSRLTPM